MSWRSIGALSKGRSESGVCAPRPLGTSRVASSRSYTARAKKRRSRPGAHLQRHEALGVLLRDRDVLLPVRPLLCLFESIPAEHQAARAALAPQPTKRRFALMCGKGSSFQKGRLRCLRVPRSTAQRGRVRSRARSRQRGAWRSAESSFWCGARVRRQSNIRRCRHTRDNAGSTLTRHNTTRHDTRHAPVSPMLSPDRLTFPSRVTPWYPSTVCLAGRGRGGGRGGEGRIAER